MEVGIVGLPRSGKTTLFNALTGSAVTGFDDKAHVGVAAIPDPRLLVIADHINPKKIINASLKLVDIPGVSAGGEAKKLAAALEQIRQVDAICLVVRCFDDGTGTVDAASDVSTMETELALADLVVAEGAKDRATRNARAGGAEAKARVELLERVTAALEEGRPVRAAEEWSDQDRTLLSSYGFITAKPVLYVANIEEDDLAGESEHVAAIRGVAESNGGGFVALSAKLEAELAECDEGDRVELLESLGLAEPAIGPLARTAHETLGLTTFYTAGEKEVRAWTIPIGANAPSAAGAIHSDIERGFIRAECYHIDDLVEHGSEKKLKEVGRLRSEGKGYVMQDGDVVHFLFNV